jgi:hypothetical protein
VGRIDERLAEVADVLPAIREFSVGLVQDAVVLADGTVLMGHAPSVAPQAYRVSIFPPAPEAWLRSLEKAADVTVPDDLYRVLRVMNGCHCFELSLFGVAGSDLLDRGVRAPLRLAFALEDWAHDYGRAGEFYFGSAPWTYEEDVGYFWSPSGPCSARTTGAIVGKWPTLNALLLAELGRLTGQQGGVH